MLRQEVVNGRDDLRCESLLAVKTILKERLEGLCLQLFMTSEDVKQVCYYGRRVLLVKQYFSGLIYK